VSFIETLPDKLPVEPDLVLGTGDFVENDTGIDPIVEALGGLRARLGKFYVFGSHDYYRSVFTLNSYAKYLTHRRKKVAAPRIDTARLANGLADYGWHAVTNSDIVLNDEDDEVRITGVDDPYIWRQRLGHVQRGPGDSVAIGLMHSPDVVSAFALENFDLVLAGHTHGGQVRLPGWGAIVTNCSLAPQLAGGLNRVGSTWLHVSPGLGTSRSGPIRFACRPEATMLYLRPSDSLP
jgi:predicted MPP superfamily phosphohydrolase